MIKSTLVGIKMNIEELRKLKEQLENQRQYMIVSQLTTEYFDKARGPLSYNEILALENTDEFIEQCEKFLEDIVNLLTIKGIPFDQITISSNIGFICRPEYLEELKNLYQNDDFTAEECYIVDKKLETQIIPGIVPLTFELNEASTGTEEYTIQSFTTKLETAGEDLRFKKISGIVNWEKFVTQMKALGYEFEFLNYEGGTSFKDYIETYKQNNFDTEVDIIADFGRNKKPISPKI